MKKITRRQQEIFDKLGYRRYCRTLNRKDKKYGGLVKKPQIIGNSVSLVAPETLSFYEIGSTSNNFDATTAFISQIEYRFGKINTIIDFGNTTRITAAAMVALYASIDSCKVLPGVKRYIFWPKRAPSVSRAIRAAKLHKLVVNPAFKSRVDSSDNLPIISGVGRDAIEDVLDYIQEDIYKNDMSPETEHIYGDAVTETINNVRLHAYPKFDENSKKWWLICEVVGDELYLAIYDKGVGIPKTVLEKPWFLTSLKHEYPEKYKELQAEIPDLERSGLRIYIPKKIEDCKLIFLSMKGDVSGTKVSKHGQGSKSIKSLVSQT